MNAFSLKGKTALVAGASRGIGLAIAWGLGAAGARTILAARSVEKLQDEAKAMTTAGAQATALRLDITDSQSIRTVAETSGDVDILVNVAGTNVRKAFIDYTREEYDQMLQTNLHGIVELTQLVGKRMIERGRGGKVVMIGSLMSLVSVNYVSVYAITKGGIGQLTRALAAEWGPYDIQVNCIAPGFIVTDLNRKMWQEEEMQTWLRGAQANPRLGSPEDVAPLAVFLAGAGADYITGQIIPVDGGFTTTRRWPYEP